MKCFMGVLSILATASSFSPAPKRKDAVAIAAADGGNVGDVCGAPPPDGLPSNLNLAPFFVIARTTSSPEHSACGKEHIKMHDMHMRTQPHDRIVAAKAMSSPIYKQYCMRSTSVAILYTALHEEHIAAS